MSGPVNATVSSPRQMTTTGNAAGVGQPATGGGAQAVGQAAGGAPNTAVAQHLQNVAQQSPQSQNNIESELLMSGFLASAYLNDFTTKEKTVTIIEEDRTNGQQQATVKGNNFSILHQLRENFKAADMQAKHSTGSERARYEKLRSDIEREYNKTLKEAFQEMLTAGGKINEFEGLMRQARAMQPPLPPAKMAEYERKLSEVNARFKDGIEQLLAQAKAFKDAGGKIDQPERLKDAELTFGQRLGRLFGIVVMGDKR